MRAAILIDLLGGLVLFLFGVLQLASGVEALAGDRARAWLSRWTSNRVAAVITGAVATTLLDSSSVTIILVIALVNGGLLSFSQSLGVIMGANIGTTISSQIFALDVEAYAPLVMLVGFALFVGARGSLRLRSAGLSVLGLGMVFFGLGFMGEAVAPLRDDPRVVAWLTGLERPVVGAAVGMVLTIVLQSSSAMLGMVIAMAGQGLLTLPAALAVMLGAEVGTCADTLIASIGRTTRRQTIRDRNCLSGTARRVSDSQHARPCMKDVVSRSCRTRNVPGNNCIAGVLLAVPGSEWCRLTRGEAVHRPSSSTWKVILGAASHARR